MAILAFTARMVHRLKSRGRLSLEDCVLMFGFACLSAVTGILYRFTRIVFLFEAAARDRPIYYTFTIQDIILLKEASSIVLIGNAGMCFTWTAIYSVKFFFLALFRLLIRRVSTRIRIYFWVVVAVTMLFWVMQIGLIVVPCQRLDLSDKCRLIFPRVSSLADQPYSIDICRARTTMVQPLGNVCDIATDIMSKHSHLLTQYNSQLKKSILSHHHSVSRPPQKSNEIL